MLLAIDIGNTNITLGVFDGDKLRTNWRVATGIHRMADEYASLLLDLFDRRGIASSQIKEAAVCSVVPPLITVFEEVCRRYLKISPLIVQAGVKTGVRILLDNPREVGPDRVVNAAAAHHLYGGPLIVIDLGTAITFDTVSKEGDYLGGAIAPGIAIATEALFNRTAMLPRVELIPPKKAIGKNTVAAMQSGIVYGYVALIEGMVNRIRQELEGEVKIIATGGYAELLARETPVIQEVNPDLTLIGLRLIYEMNRS
ncbi:MAG: Type III pantothenate kinase [Syntrophomonadaceae bacterium]|nr:Type III pantothenate kinase [Bacillota bacterium]